MQSNASAGMAQEVKQEEEPLELLHHVQPPPVIWSAVHAAASVWVLQGLSFCATVAETSARAARQASLGMAVK